MAKQITERLDEILKSDDLSSEDLNDFVSELRSNLKTSEEKSRREILLLVSAMLVFTLLALSSPSEVSFGPLKFTDTSWALLCLPPITSFLFYQWLCTMSFRALLRDCLWHYFKVKQPVLYERDFERLVSYPSFINMEALLHVACGGSRASKLNQASGNMISLAMAFAPMIWLFWAGYHVFVMVPSSIVLKSVSSGIALFILVKAILAFSAVSQLR